jgi:hypothetical protein
MLDQFDRLRKRNAFLEQYKKEKMFEHGLEEFDDARYAHSVLTQRFICNMRLCNLEQHAKNYLKSTRHARVQIISHMLVVTLAVIV